MRFIGNKQSLVSKIYSLLQAHKIIDSTKIQSFFDVFAGSASVGKFFKQKGFEVYSCDMMYFSYCLQKAYIENNNIPSFVGLEHIIKKDYTNNSLFNTQNPYAKVLAYLNALVGKQGFIYQNYAPSATEHLKTPRMYFSDDNAAKIDAIRMQIELWRDEDSISENEYFILLATLIESISFYANVAGVYAAFCKTWDKRALKNFTLKEIELLKSEKTHSCFCGNSLELLQTLQTSHTKIFDILYLIIIANTPQTTIS